MASKYYDSTGKEVFDGDLVYASDLNTINSAVDSAFQTVATDVSAAVVDSLAILTKAQAWAENPEDSQVEAGKYSALHWAAKASYSSISATASAASATSSASSASTNASLAQGYATSTAADRVQTGLDRVATSDDRSAVQAIADGIPTVPTGVVVAYIPGYFTNGSNGGFTNMLGNSVASANSLLNPYYWYVCNGAQINISVSSMFNGSGRYLPNLTDDRFLMGDLTAGTTGGVNSNSHVHTMSHTHTTGDHALTINQIPSHAHLSGFSNQSGTDPGGNTIQEGNGSQWTDYMGYTGGGAVHNHGTTGGSSSSSTGSQTVTENRPLFLSCLYIMKVAS